MERSQCLAIAVMLLLATLGGSARAERIDVVAGESIQAAIDGAAEGDEIVLGAGRYQGDIDFLGKAIFIRGVGHKTVVVGSGEGPVVRFTNGEGNESVLDSIRVTGGRAIQGGGILIRGASPVVVRCVITRNRASARGSGIHIERGSKALIFNNLITFNRRAGGGDPHSVEIVDAAPIVANNTIARGDSNGVILRGVSSAIIVNNVIAWNGARVGGKLRGRGICDFSGGVATIVGNVFHRNRIAALLRNGTDYKRVASLQNGAGDARVRENRDGNPGVRRTPPRKARLSRPRHFSLRRNGRAVDGGIEAPVCTDEDGSRTDAGWTGGPFAEGAAAPLAIDACVRGLSSL